MLLSCDNMKEVILMVDVKQKNTVNLPEAELTKLFEKKIIG